MSSQYAQHFYDEMMKAMRNSSNDIVRNAIERQSDQVLTFFDETLADGAVDTASQMAEAFIEINTIYDGARPDFSSLALLVVEMSQHDIHPGTPEFREQVSGAAEFGSLDTFHMDSEGNPQPAANPDRDESHILDTGVAAPEVHPLYEPWLAAVANAKEAKSIGDEYAEQAAHRVLDSLRSQIGDAPSHTEGTPHTLPSQPEVDHSDDPDFEAGHVPDDADYTDREQEADARLEDEMESRYNPDESTHEDQFGHEVLD